MRGHPNLEKSDAPIDRLFENIDQVRLEPWHCDSGMRVEIQTVSSVFGDPVDAPITRP